MSILGDKIFDISAAIGPLKYNYAGTDTDATHYPLVPANNRGLPTLGMFVLDGVQVPVNKDTTTPSNNVLLPVEDLTANAFWSSLIGQLARAASLGVTLSTEDIALLTQIRDNGNPDNTLIAIYHNAGSTAVTTAGITVGVLGSAGKNIVLQNNADAVQVLVNSNLVGVSLPGQTLSLNSNMTAGNIDLKSMTGGDITGGDFAITITG